MTAKQLKNSILQQAIQGKLINQNKEDKPASELLKRIKAEREKLIKSGKIKINKNISAIYRKGNSFYEKIENEEICIDEELPFAIPKTWEWVRLDYIAEYKKGPFGSSLRKSMFVHESKTSVKVYEQKNAIKKDHNIGSYYINYDYFKNKMSGFEVKSGDIIVSCAGTIGEAYVLPEGIKKGIINQALMRIRLFAPINIKYFLIYFDFIIKNITIRTSKGSAIKNIPPFEIFKKLFLPLPPIEEQKRIVNKLNQLMPLIEEYEEKENKLNELDKKFPERLKKSILKEAVEGKLINQNKKDKPASELLKRIKAEREKLIKSGKIKINKNISAIYRKGNSFYEKIENEEICIDEELPFEIPKTWEWVRLYNISKNITAGGDKPNKFSKCSTKECSIPVLSNGEKDFGLFGYTDIPRITEHSITVSGRGTIGFSCVRRYPYTPIVRLICIIPMNIINLDYLQIVLTTLLEKGVGTSIKQLTVPMLSPKLIPLPPIEEQKRIVEKLDKLINACEELKKILFI